MVQFVLRGLPRRVRAFRRLKVILSFLFSQASEQYTVRTLLLSTVDTSGWKDYDKMCNLAVR